MSRVLTLGLACASLLLAASAVPAQTNPRGTAKLALSGKMITVEYGRPALKGRKINDLIDQLKADQVWRLGADKSTTFSTTGALEFEGNSLPEGTYSLWAVPDASGNWELRFNKQHGQWGTRHDPSQDLIGVLVDESRASTNEELLTIALREDNGTGILTIQWGDMVLSTEFEVR